MRNYLIVIFVLIFFNNVSANTGLIGELEDKHCNVSLNEIDCSSLYNATLAFCLLRKYPQKVAEATAATAREACFDENEAASGTNPDCKPVDIGLKQ